MIRLLTLRDALRGSFWFLPALLTVLATALALGLLEADRRMQDKALVGSFWLYAGGAEGARSLLAAVAGSMITVVGLAFSITIVSLQLAAAQLGPRLLRNFMRDRGNQVVLGVFVATFVYCLLVLRTVRGKDGLADGEFVPHLAVTGAVTLAMLSVGLLIYFIHHASVSIQADHVVAGVSHDLHAVIDALFPEPAPRGAAEPAAATAPNRAGPGEAPVAARRDGYVATVDRDALVRAAAEADVVVHLAARPGDFVVAGDALAWIQPAGRLEPRLERAVVAAVVLSAERTLIQDVLFGVEQLVEIAVRGLASGHIDPLTGLRCIDRLGAAVARLSERRLPPADCRDGEAVVRVVAPTVTLAEVVTAAFGAIRLHGAANRAVALRLLQTFERLAGHRDRRDMHATLLGEAVMVRRAAVQALGDAADRDQIERAFERVLRALRPDARRLDHAAPAAA